MKSLKIISVATVLGLTAVSSTAFAGARESVDTFYELLSNPGSETHAAEFAETISNDWESVGNYTGKNKTREGFLGQMGGFAKLIPDLNWDVQAVYQDGDTFIVRSRATGTPVAPMFGVDGEGRSFDIMTIDIHETKDGKITRSYHLEDWALGLQQLKGR